jgi:hypothetical protein
VMSSRRWTNTSARILISRRCVRRIICTRHGPLLTGRARVETGSAEAARDANCHGPSDGRRRTLYSRFHLSSDGERSTPHRGRIQIHVRVPVLRTLVLVVSSVIRRYKFQSSVGAYEDKTAVLSDTDTVWTDVRHMHMREAIDKLMADFNKFITDNAGFKGCARHCPRLRGYR